jgi:hypothetical protein
VSGKAKAITASKSTAHRTVTPIEYQLPNKHSRVGYLLDSVQNNDPGLQAGLANVRLDKQHGGMRSDFEATVAHILPYCPVAKKRTTGVKRGAADISVTFVEAATAEIASFGAKSGVGKTRVHLRFHKHAAYQQLSSEQKAELKEWREKEPSAGRGGKWKGAPKTKPQSSKNIKSMVDAAVAKKIEAHTKAEEDAKTQEAAAARFIVLCLERLTGKKAMPPPSYTALGTTGAAHANKTTFLKSILGRAKNRQDVDLDY